MEKMGAIVEVLLFGADEAGFWHLPGVQPWQSTEIMQDSDANFEVDLLLYRRHVRPAAVFVHSTSWRQGRHDIVLTYAVVPQLRTATVVESWPHAKPIGRDLLADNPPIPHGPAEAPTPHKLSVMGHSLRHLAWLWQTRSGGSENLPAIWGRHLDELKPVLMEWYTAAEFEAAGIWPKATA